MNNTVNRKNAYRYGLSAEKFAGMYLRCKGYRVLAERYRNPLGEIDLVALKGNTLVAVEVKARKNLKECEETITPWKQGKIARAMEGLMAGHQGLPRRSESAFAKATARLPAYWQKFFKNERNAKAGKIAGLAHAGERSIRFDVIWIAPWQWPVHIKDAWRTQ